MTTKRVILGSLLAASALAISACSNAANDADTIATEASAVATKAQEAKDKADADKGAVTFTDVKGRTVTLDKAPERVILGEGRGVFATSILDKDHPLDKVVAWGSDLKNAAPTWYANFMEAVPEAKDLPEIGNMAKGDVTVENLLSFNPDLVVMTADHYDGAQTNGLLDKMDAAGINYVVTDFRQHPLENTTKSVALLGEVFGKQDKAKQFNDEWTTKVDAVKKTAEGLDDKPSTFIWRAAGLKDCCSTVNKSNLGELVDAAGGKNLGDTLLDTESGDVTAEKLIAEQPDAIIATGGSWAAKKDKPEAVPHANLGYDTDEATAQATLQGLLATPGFDELKAPKDDEFFAVWHQFYDSPFNYIALEQFAKWLHPEDFKDLDPQKDLEQAHEKYVPFKAKGTFFVKDNVKDNA
ncbi:ABC transporter substrate-binding protein [Corynebacterium aquilae]|uniref:Ferrisiderophore receptor Irp6A n=1 Tax=Corynebacterium aquilae DSM 44791 TaxID=1431546 RepID=A0A1L7CHW3_9CORY|nr:ABC transporter substrate-binding protein [Corynebacterium aquilae]APT85434.1 ferrisiderophore receptor Irp6A [Corynebacterium aquilae DSM 44791]